MVERAEAVAVWAWNALQYRTVEMGAVYTGTMAMKLIAWNRADLVR